eukprot:11658557-Alexandrium_andersonii.AAC.1
MPPHHFMWRRAAPSSANHAVARARVNCSAASCRCFHIVLQRWRDLDHVWSCPQRPRHAMP